MKISKKNLMAFVKNHAYGDEVWYNNRSFHIV